MPDKLDDRIMKAKERVRSKQKLESMLRLANQHVQEAESECSVLVDKFHEEKVDVEKLEGLSLTGLFYSVLGTKEQRLEKERQEFLAAQLKYDEAVAALEDADRETKRLRRELALLVVADVEYDAVIAEKEQLMAETGDDSARKLLEMLEEQADLNADIKELQEAVQAGQGALDSLRQVRTELASASGWGTWDMMGGGMIPTMVKHSKIDKAKRYAHLAQGQLRRFQEELADADQRLHVSLDIGGFSKFADHFFDSLIVDWIVQSKIEESSSACASAISKVASAVDDCRQRLASTEHEIERLAKRRQVFIEQA